MNLLMWNYFYHIPTTAVWFNFSTAPVEAGTRKIMLCPVLDRFLPTLAWTDKNQWEKPFQVIHSAWYLAACLIEPNLCLHRCLKHQTWRCATAPNVAPPAGSPLWRPGSVTLRWWSGAGLPNEHWQGAGHRFWQCPKSAKWADSLVTEGTSLLEVPKRHENDSRSKCMILCIFSCIERSFVPRTHGRPKARTHLPLPAFDPPLCSRHIVRKMHSCAQEIGECLQDPSKHQARLQCLSFCLFSTLDKVECIKVKYLQTLG